MFKSEPVDRRLEGIFLCFYVDRHVNIRRKSSYHDGLNPWLYFKSQHITEQKMLFMMVGEG